jgi:two-component system chemotaxis sensor kinase CheA
MHDEGFDLEALIDAFRTETDENLAQMEEGLLKLETSPDDAEVVNTVFRAAHTVKGGAATVGVDAVVRFSHLVEDLLDRIREKELAATPAIISLLLGCVDHLRATLPGAIGGDHEPVLATVLVPRLEKAIETGECEESEAVETSQQEAQKAVVDTLRVPTSRLDSIVNLTGEIAIARGRLREIISALPDASRHLLETRELLDRLADDLQEQVMTLRMVSLDPLFRRCARQVRDLARSQGKLIQLHIEGEDVEIDSSIVEQVGDVLLHVVRNSIDHGIETPDARMSAGKPMSGRLSLRAFHDAGMIAIDVEDDGKGIDRSRIVEKARSLGLVGSESDGLTEAELNRLIFSPGFSTAEQVSEVSGRGVGMDVVQKRIAAMRGSVHLSSEAGRGTTVRIRLPLTIAIVESLAVRAGSETFVLPLDYVTECIDLDYGSLDAAVSGLTEVRGKAMPFLRLGRSLGAGESSGVRGSLVLVRHGDQQVGLVLDELIGRMQAVLKPLSGSVRRHEGIAGATVLGDGAVAFVLDVPRLLQHHLQEVA